MFNKKRIIAIVIFLLLSFFLLSFGNPVDTEPLATRVVKFIDGYNNSLISEQDVEVGGDAVIPNIPTHRNYVFTGWFEEDGQTQVTDFTNIINNLTVTGNYAPDRNNNGIPDEDDDYFSVRFVDTITNTTLKTQSVLVGLDATAPTIPVHEGYTFLGWNGSYVNVTSNRVIETNYASTPATIMYNVTFIDTIDNQTISIEAVEQGYSATTPIPPVHEKKVFTHWEGNYSNVQNDEIVNAIYSDDRNENKIPDEDEYVHVRYDVNGGTPNVIDLKDYLSGDTVSVNDTKVSKENVTFLGWESKLVDTISTQEEEDNLKLYGNSFVISENTTLYAVWAIDRNKNDIPDYKEYIGVTYDANGAIGDVPVDKTSYLAKDEVSVKDLSSTLTKNLETFIGWSFDKFDTIKTNDEEDSASLLGDNFIITKDTTLYATFGEDKNSNDIPDYKDTYYDVKFHDRSSSVIKTEKVLVGLDATAPSDPIEKGYTFKNWDKNYTNVQSNLNVYSIFDRNSYMVTVDYLYDDSVTKMFDTVSSIVLYNDVYNINVIPKAGYSTNPKDSFSDIMGTANVEATVIYSANEDTKYTVEHYLQNVNDDKYSMDPNKDTKSGTTDTNTDATSRSYTGFTAQSFTQKNIDGNGNTVVKIYYNRNSYDVNYYVDGVSKYTDTYKYGANVSARANETKEGYTFSGWSTIPTTMPAENVKVDGAFTINSYTLTIKYNYSDGKTARDTFSSTMNYNTSYNVKSPVIDGYTADTLDVASTMPAKNVDVTVTYTANNNTIYHVEHYIQPLDDNSSLLETNLDKYSLESTDTKSGVTGALTDATSNNYDGFTAYEFSQKEIAGNGTTVVRINYSRNVNTQYTVIYRLQNMSIATQYDEVATATEKLTGITGALTNATAKTFAGFTALPIEQQVIKGNGSTIVYVDYNRNINTPYKAEHYTQPLDSTNTTVVNDLSKYVLDHTDNLSGKTDSETDAASTIISGYTALAFEQTTIAGNGSTVVKIYYNRNSYDVNYYVDGVSKYTDTYKYGANVSARANETKEGYTFSGWSMIPTTMPAENVKVDGTFGINSYTLTIKYNYSDGEVARDTFSSAMNYNTSYNVKSPVIAGYTADTLDVASTMPAKNVDVTVRYSANNNTIYHVEHYQESVTDASSYTYVETDTMSGTTGNKTVAVAKNYVGFTKVDFEQQTINGNGSTVVVINYTRNNVNYLVKHLLQDLNSDTYTEDESLRDTLSGKTGYTTNAVAKVIPGFTADTVTQKTINGDGTTIVEIKYTRNNNTAYKVNHYQQNVNNENYSLIETDNMSGTTGSETAAVAKNYAGFTAQSFSQKTIAGDGQTVVDIYYNRNTNTVYTIKHSLESVDGNSYELKDTESKTGKTGAQTNAEAKHYDGFSAQSFSQKTIAGDGSTVIEIKYTRLDVNYKVVHHEQNINNDGYSVIDTETLTGRTGTMTEAVAKTINGFNSQKFTQEIINGNGQTVINIYYDRNTNTAYKVVHRQQSVLIPTDYRVVDTVSMSGKTGAQTNAVANNYPGFTVQPFAQASIAGDGSTVITIDYNRNTNTAYTVKHYLQNLDDLNEYTLKDTVSMTGKTGDNTYATENSYTGFTAQSFDQTTISGDGQTVVDIYYNRNKHDVIYKVDGNNHYEMNDVVYGTALSLIDNPTKEGYTFSGWSALPESMPDNDVNVTGTFNINSYLLTVEYKYTNGNTASDTYSSNVTYNSGYSVNSPVIAGYTPDVQVVSGTMPAENVSRTVTYTANSNTKYTVNHYLQNIENNEYTLDDTTSSVGTTDTNTAATAKTYAGFTAQTITQKNIAGDGSTVIDIYYNRNSYDVNYYVDGVSKYTDTYKYGANVSARDDETKEGYTFSGWSTVPTTMSAENVRVDGTFAINSYTLTIKYNYSDGEVARDTFSSTMNYNTSYNVESPVIAGYTPNDDAVSGVMPANNVTLTVTYTANSNTIYHVEHLLQSIDNVDSYSQVAVDTMSGVTGAETAAVAKTYTGFTAQAITQKTIDGNGTTVVEVKYTRNSYTLSLISGTNIENVIGAGTYKYGSEVTINATLASIPNYNVTFDQWTSSNTDLLANNTTKNLSFNMVAGDLTLTASADKTEVIPNIEIGEFVVTNYPDSNNKAAEPNKTVEYKLVINNNETIAETININLNSEGTLSTEYKVTYINEDGTKTTSTVTSLNSITIPANGSVSITFSSVVPSDHVVGDSTNQFGTIVNLTTNVGSAITSASVETPIEKSANVIAANSNSKNVVLIVDLSGSMNDDGKITSLKSAAKDFTSNLYKQASQTNSKIALTVIGIGGGSDSTSCVEYGSNFNSQTLYERFTINSNSSYPSNALNSDNRDVSGNTCNKSSCTYYLETTDTTYNSAKTYYYYYYYYYYGWRTFSYSNSTCTKTVPTLSNSQGYDNSGMFHEMDDQVYAFKIGSYTNESASTWIPDSKINGFSANGGTDITGSLILTQNILKNVDAYRSTYGINYYTDDADTFTVLLTDGANGPSGNIRISSTADEVQYVRNNSSLFAIGFGEGAQVGTDGYTDLLAITGDSGLIYNASSTSDLNNAFNEIASKIGEQQSKNGEITIDLPTTDKYYPIVFTRTVNNVDETLFTITKKNELESHNVSISSDGTKLIWNIAGNTYSNMTGLKVTINLKADATNGE